ncbi:PREDICTED: probable serine/threonine-protein kinase kinX isoform X1 [Papilio xuthus]|uniref:Probable serine/threonine-protein kinase kinX isoform X1 n=1 Tax=Papilio xuthus TaxID=66420 RepID=A0AAJ6ZE81_PAPXU|nr:PREDICTED: probable serine/threonine-protein kinase kinX isoform X1 [Papilio xuthus]
MMVKMGQRTFRLYKPVYHKSFKAERINALRKQYDSFIEEDKKRKDRNEYILERLDKIRTTSAIVQVRNTPKDYFTTGNQNLVYDRKHYMSNILPMYEKPQYCLNPVNNFNLTMPIQNEQEILKEISKKYILIPRFRNILENNDNHLLKSNIDDNSDWRKKYSILEELKQNEKEDKQKTNLNICKDFTTINIKDGELNYNKIEEPKLQPELLLSEYNKNSSKTLQDNSGEIAYFDEVNDTEINKVQKPEIKKDFSNNSKNSKDFNKPISNSQTENLTQNTDSKMQPMTYVTAPQESPTRDDNINVIDELPNEGDVVETDLNSKDLTQKEKMQTEYERELKPKEEDIPVEKVQYSNIKSESEDLKETAQSANYHQDKGKHEVFEENNIKSNIDSDIKRDNNISKDLNSEQTSQPPGVDGPLLIENINSTVPNTEQEEANPKLNQIESHEEQKAPIIANINPVVQNLENISTDAQIHEFETEQMEMFHSGPNVTEYAYDQTGNVVNDGYVNTVGYAQDENYAYYEGTQQQQLYSTDINDHEESTEQYDPHYEAQYAKYENQDHIIDEQYENYEAEENITQQQLYDQVQYEEPDYNVIQEVERELDAEQNYNNIEQSIDDNITNIIDEAIVPEDESEPVAENPVPTS